MRKGQQCARNVHKHMEKEECEHKMNGRRNENGDGTNGVSNEKKARNAQEKCASQCEWFFCSPLWFALLLTSSSYLMRAL